MEISDIHRPTTSSITIPFQQAKSAKISRVPSSRSRISIKSSISQRTLKGKTTSLASVLTPKFKPQSLLTVPDQFSDEKSLDFPKWLMERSDFKSCLTSYSQKSDIVKICSKPFKLREVWEVKELKAYIKSCVLFKDLTDFTCSELCEKLTTVTFSAGDILIRQGEVGDSMFVIVAGRVSVYLGSTLIDRISDKNIVGEKSLESNLPRNATVIADTHLEALQLKKDDYRHIVLRNKHKQIFHIVEFLKTLSFFKDLLNAKLELLAFNMIAAYYKENQQIFLENQPANSLYFVKAGSVKLSMSVTLVNRRKIPNLKKETRVEKKVYEKTLKFCKSGEFFGEEEMIVHGLRLCNAVCVSECEIFILKKENLEEILNEKEISDLLKTNQLIPDRFEAARIVRKSIGEKSNKIKAIYDACEQCQFGIVNGRKSKADGIFRTFQKSESDLCLLESESYFE
jgi:CRP-like cAMP-binding protein